MKEDFFHGVTMDESLNPTEVLSALGIHVQEIGSFDPETEKLTLTDERPALQPIENTGNPKDLIGATKPDLSLVPPAGMLYEAQAFMDGAAKYGPYNWRENPVKMRVYIAAAMRHLQQMLDGEDFDPLSGVHHTGHARACLGIIADARETGNLIDDRPVKGPAGEMIRHYGDFRTYEHRDAE